VFLIDSIKRQLHRDICRDPVLHGLVLNFYLNGEAYPDRVADYFPVARADEPEIAAHLAAHLRDERKHVALYSKALQRLAQPQVEFPLPQVYNSMILAQTPAMQSGASSGERRVQLAGFFAHLHFLERRIAHSLEIHADACTHSPSRYPAQAVSAVLSDERRHVQYTRDVFHDLVPDRRAAAILAHHRRAEARANLLFSGRQLGMLTRDYATRFPRLRRPIYRIAAAIQEGIVHDG